MVEAKTRVRCLLDRKESIEDVGNGKGGEDLMVAPPSPTPTLTGA